MSAQGYYEGQLKEALENLLHWHRDGNRLTRQDAFKRLNKTVSDQIEELVKEEKDD